MNYNNLIVDFFTGMRGVDNLFEDILNGLYGGVQSYNVEPNEGNFDKDFLIKFVKINAGDNDFDYELGRIGYTFLTSDEGLKELSKYYLEELKTYKSEYVTDDVISNCRNSLLNIFNLSFSYRGTELPTQEMIDWFDYDFNQEPENMDGLESDMWSSNQEKEFFEEFKDELMDLSYFQMLDVFTKARDKKY